MCLAAILVLTTDALALEMAVRWQCYMYFVERCRAKGISVPIIPGVMCINTVPVSPRTVHATASRRNGVTDSFRLSLRLQGFKRMVSLCKTRVPDELWAQVEATPTDCEDAGRQLGINFGRDLCRR